MRKPTIKARFTAHKREAFDARGRRYDIRLNTGMRVIVVESGPRVEEIEWQSEWGRFNPASDDVAAIAIEEFNARQERRLPINRINAELLHPERQLRKPAPCQFHDDQQLPAGDRL